MMARKFLINYPLKICNKIGRFSLCRLMYLLIPFLLCLLYVMKTNLNSLYETDSTIFEKYWLIEHIGEQLGKAKFHFMEQVTIANLLNRTLVLPNVGNSEIGLRLDMPFTHYYQANNIKTIARTLSTAQLV